MILGGDLNCCDSALDKFGSNVSFCTDLTRFKSCFNLIKACRFKHARVSLCMLFNSDLSIGSRLDSFLVVHDLANTLTSSEILPCPFSDHDFVTLEVDVSLVYDLGPGVCKFNNSPLDDREYCVFITAPRF